MISDILTVMWKERKLLLRQHGSRTRLLFTLLVPVIMFSIFLPWQIGTGWVEGYWSLLASVLVPLLLVGTVIPESFAGERERHTLGTLLASRLPDRAILYGKIALAVGYAWLMTFLTLIVSLATINIAHWNGQITLFTPAVALINVFLTLLLAIIMANLGVLISLRASTVQGATQTLMAAVMFPLIILQVAGLIVLQMQRQWLDSIIDTLANANWTLIIVLVTLVVTAICLLLLWMATTRFQRARLILS